MKKLTIAIVAAGLGAACSDASFENLMVPNSNFAVSDGGSGGNPHFFFQSPLVPSPDPQGVFNPDLEPIVEVHSLADPSDLRCDPTANPVDIFDDFDVSQSLEIYGFGYNTSQSNLTDGADYRLCVKVFDFALGYRDIRPLAPGVPLPPDPGANPFFEFTNGTWFPIQLRIEEGALCQRGVVDCTEQIIGPAGGTAVCDNSLCGIELQPQSVNQPFLFIVELLDCPVDGNGNVQHINADIPQFPGCLEITVEPKSAFSSLNIPALAAACYDAPNLSHDQQGRLQLHHQKDDGTIEALPNAQAGFLDCSNYTAIAQGAGPMAIYARNMWRKVKDVVLPGPLNATDRGFGGRGFTEESPFVWALPSQMTQVNWTNPELGHVGDVKTAVAQVLDEAGDPVENATVHFDVTNGSGPPTGVTSVLTDAAGMAALDWTLGPSGPNRLEASGLGIGLVAGADGTHLILPPPGGDGVYADHTGNVVDLGRGVLHFDATVCSAGPDVDGAVASGEYANSASFTANIQGGSTPAVVYWTNDCDNLYMALEVVSNQEVVNDLRFVFDNDNDGVPEIGDDVLFFERTKAGPHVFSDRHRPSRCNGQSDCSVADPGGNDGTAVFGFDAVAGVSTYEMVHPLSSGDASHDFQLNLGDSVGFYLVLQIGKGAQGNTEFGDFESYTVINIATP